VDPIRLDPYVLDALMPDLVGHDRKPSAFIVFLFLWRRTCGVGRDSVCLSHRMIADGTGLSPSSVQAALIATERRTPTSAPVFSIRRHWAQR
jgi:hypothetical protein